MITNSNNFRLDFGNLPMLEAAVRLSFGTPVGLSFRLINDVAKQIKKDFPLLEEPRQFEVAPGVEGKFEIGPNQITGALFTGNQKGLCITLQGQVIVVRWLKQGNPGAPDYPRFAALSDAMWKAHSALQLTCEDNNRPIHVINMSYVNFLQLPHASPVLERYFSDIVQVKATAKAQQIQNIGISWRDHEGTDLRFSLEQVTAQIKQEKVEGYRLTTAAGRLFSGLDNEREILDQIHLRLQLFFRDLLSDAAKEEWQLKEVKDG